VVLSKGREVVEPSYSRVRGVAAKVTDKKENSDNHGRVNWVSKIEQHYPSWVNWVSENSNLDRQADRVGRVSPRSSMDQRTDQASRVYRVSRVSSTEQKIGGSSHVANTEV
jgi:hypothetical protein